MYSKLKTKQYKKLQDIFVSKNHHVISETPYWQNLILHCKNKECDIKYIKLILRR